MVTGGGSGIGEGLVEAFVAQGARVAFVDIADAPSRALVERLTPGADHAPLFTPLRPDRHRRRCKRDHRRRSRQRSAASTSSINNAANDDRHTIEEVTPEYWDERMAVNLRHLFFAAQAVVPAMKRAGRRRDPQFRLDQLAPRACPIWCCTRPPRPRSRA